MRGKMISTHKDLGDSLDGVHEATSDAGVRAGLGRALARGSNGNDLLDSADGGGEEATRDSGDTGEGVLGLIQG